MGSGRGFREGKRLPGVRGFPSCASTMVREISKKGLAKDKRLGRVGCGPLKV